MEKFLKDHKVKEILFIPYAGANVSPLGVPLNYDEYMSNAYALFIFEEEVQHCMITNFL